MEMEKVSDKNLPSQGFRSPSGRREDPTVPEVPPFLSGEGPASSLPTGEKYERATVETEVERDPLELTFVDCLSAMEAVPQSHNQEAIVVSTPITGTKRKAKKVSSDAPSDDEPGANISGTQKGSSRSPEETQD
ncbi:methenyltetrahydrofolate cyclohydrolase [Lasius niger]|uniref:Methenyltetrahydrofolate cyclohydrolase n=1 Tax=Lasius niger TaxID=67767 RepID=A0A0J7KN13_LASNI|nr:methenyltetrahydrofolate cyclohydrolase [Lasius niger]